MPAYTRPEQADRAETIPARRTALRCAAWRSRTSPGWRPRALEVERGECPTRWIPLQAIHDDATRRRADADRGSRHGAHAARLARAGAAAGAGCASRWPSATGWTRGRGRASWRPWRRLQPDSRAAHDGCCGWRRVAVSSSSVRELIAAGRAGRPSWWAERSPATSPSTVCTACRRPRPRPAVGREPGGPVRGPSREPERSVRVHRPSQSPRSQELLAEIARYAADKKAGEVVELDLREVLGYTDWFVICSGNTERQTKAIHDGILEGLQARARRASAPRRGA